MKEILSSYEVFNMPTKDTVDSLYVLNHIKEFVESEGIEDCYLLLDVTNNHFSFDSGDIVFESVTCNDYEAQVVGMFTDSDLSEIDKNKEKFYYIIKVEYI